jgi:hypothetical protein
MNEYADLKASTPKMTNVIGALFYQEWYEDRTADETLALAFGKRDDLHRSRVVDEVNVLLEQLRSEHEVRDYLRSFDLDVDFDRDFPTGARRWLEGARAVVARLRGHRNCAAGKLDLPDREGWRMDYQIELREYPLVRNLLAAVFNQDWREDHDDVEDVYAALDTEPEATRAARAEPIQSFIATRSEHEVDDVITATQSGINPRSDAGLSGRDWLATVAERLGGSS